MSPMSDEVTHAVLLFLLLLRLQVLFDLGCGDGRICIEAATRFRARARGVEIEAFLVERFQRQIAAHNVQQLVSVSHGDLLVEDLSDATVVVTYLLPEALEQLSAKLIALLRSSDKHVRVICNTWGIRDLVPDERYDAGPYRNVPLFVYRSRRARGRDKSAIDEHES